MITIKISLITRPNLVTWYVGLLWTGRKSLEGVRHWSKLGGQCPGSYCGTMRKQAKRVPFLLSHDRIPSRILFRVLLVIKDGGNPIKIAENAHIKTVPNEFFAPPPTSCRWRMTSTLVHSVPFDSLLWSRRFTTCVAEMSRPTFKSDIRRASLVYDFWTILADPDESHADIKVIFMFWTGQVLNKKLRLIVEHGLSVW